MAGRSAHGHFFRFAAVLAAVDLAEVFLAVKFFLAARFAISALRALATAIPPRTAPTAAPSGPISDPAAAPTRAPPGARSFVFRFVSVFLVFAMVHSPDWSRCADFGSR